MSPSPFVPNGRTMPPMVAHLHRVGKIALITALLSSLCLAGAIFFLTANPNDSYAEIFASHMLGKRHLLSALTLSGMVLVSLTALVTWVIVLYSTYRVAGPLHRLSQTLEKKIADAPTPLEKPKPTDPLYEEHLVMVGSVERMQSYYDNISELVDLARSQFELPDPNLNDGLAKTMASIRKLDSMVQL